MLTVDMLTGDDLFYVIKVVLSRLIHILIDQVYRSPVHFTEQMHITIFQALGIGIPLVQQ